jgi:hypothetical protein
MTIVLNKMRVILFAREAYVNIRFVGGGHVENLDKLLKQQVLQNYTGGSGGCQLGDDTWGRHLGWVKEWVSLSINKKKTLQESFIELAHNAEDRKEQAESDE